MTVHLFGAVSSPGCANVGLKHAAKDNEDEFGKDTSNFIRRDFYVDDGLKSVSTVAEAITLIGRSRELCMKGGLRLHKFMSNSKDVLVSIPTDDHARELKDLDLALDSLPIERALGVHWCVASDTFQFRITLKDQPFTRRGVLSTVSSVFDPLGFLAPVILVGKKLLQQMCKDDINWDAPLPDELRCSWERWQNSLFHLEQVEIPRCFKPGSFGDVRTTELHHFSDASLTGYGQCSYLRQVDCDGQIHCAFVMGKARVTPLRPITVPRLELTAALVSVKVSQLLRRELQLENVSEFFWTDSRIVLGYVSNDARRFQTFVANRIQQIRDVTSPTQWRHVSTDVNPADAASRGIESNGFSKSSAWLHGPDFLWAPTAWETDENGPEYSLNPEDPEVRKVRAAATSVEPVSNTFDLQRLSHLSDWFHARRAVANCLRLKRCLMKRVTMKLESEVSAPLCLPVTVEDLVQAETLIIKAVQLEAFVDDLKHLKSVKADKCDDTTGHPRRKTVKRNSQLYKLDPYLDDDGVLRVGGRLRQSSLPWHTKHPAILPRRGHVTTLVIRHFHERLGHPGRGLTINAIRENGFWITGCSSAVTQLISKCVECRRLHNTTQEQKMADLPEDRVEPAPPFSYCAVDLFGPWLIKEGRKEIKRYGVLFTCMVSRAVHIEVANSLDTASFINALRRFICLRGPVRQMRSDCGTNFIGADRELREEYERLDHSAVTDFLLKESCDYFEFRRNVPSASHMGGVWERQIRTVRRVLSGLLRQSGTQLDDECLRTLMREAAATVNSRPLTTQNLNDPTSLKPLTPNHLLTMKAKIVLPPAGPFQRADLYSRKRWRRVQHLANEFWYRWRREYLQSCQVRHKWNTPRREMTTGDIVLIKDENLPRNRWRLARVRETYPDSDGHVRKVRLVVGNSGLDSSGKRIGSTADLDRPVHKLVLILENE